MKTCSKCKKDFPIEEFNHRRSYCKDCQRMFNRAYHKKYCSNPEFKEKAVIRARQWRNSLKMKNIEEYHNKRNLEARKRWIKSKEKIKQVRRKWRNTPENKVKEKAIWYNYRKNLGYGYINSLLNDSIGVSGIKFPNEIIEAKKIQLKIKFLKVI